MKKVIDLNLASGWKYPKNLWLYRKRHVFLGSKSLCYKHRLGAIQLYSIYPPMSDSCCKTCAKKLASLFSKLKKVNKENG